MSYEGYVEHLCANGHLWVEPELYEDEALCPHCEEPSAWGNSVDDTNCESFGTIRPEGWETLKVTPEVEAVCNLGHRHTLTPARYRVPTEVELEELRHYWDSTSQSWCKIAGASNG